MSARRQRLHECQAKGCNAQVPVHLLMCPTHWAMVPKASQRVVWATYRERDWSGAKHQAYLDAVQAAVAAVAKKEEERLAQVRERMGWGGTDLFSNGEGDSK